MYSAQKKCWYQQIYFLSKNTQSFYNWKILPKIKARTVPRTQLCAYESAMPRSKNFDFCVHLKQSSDMKFHFWNEDILMSHWSSRPISTIGFFYWGKCHMLRITLACCVRGRTPDMCPLSAFKILLLRSSAWLKKRSKHTKLEILKIVEAKKKRELYFVYIKHESSFQTQMAQIQTFVRVIVCVKRKSVHVPRLTYVMFSFFFFLSLGLFCALFYLLLLLF